MAVVTGKMRNGAAVPDVPTDWPDGCDVKIEKVDESAELGIRDEDWPTTPEGIEEWIRWYESTEPLILTPEDEAAIKAAWKAHKDYQIATWDERCRKIEKNFE